MARPGDTHNPKRPVTPARPAAASRRGAARPAAPLTLPGLEPPLPPDVAHYRRLLLRIELDLARQRTEPA